MTRSENDALRCCESCNLSGVAECIEPRENKHSGIRLCEYLKAAIMQFPYYQFALLI